MCLKCWRCADIELERVKMSRCIDRIRYWCPFEHFCKIDEDSFAISYILLRSDLIIYVLSCSLMIGFLAFISLYLNFQVAVDFDYGLSQSNIIITQIEFLFCNVTIFCCVSFLFLYQLCTYGYETQSFLTAF